MSSPVRSTRKSLPIALLRARETVMAPIREMLAASPVNEQKWRVLRVLVESGPLEQKAIAAEACLLLPSLTRILQTMEADGLVSRESDLEDRRRSIVSVTAAGRAVIENHADQSNAILARLEDQFGKERLDDLLRLLDDLQHIDL
ncbi:MAG: homoprotocatechuate degradation operon regulator HpaR [Rhodobacterales bacterium 32-67-9]|nr:MAG: homoprotocatechuate degradation operon regulator HpaR [Rhodobacterales bacterium 32-67-9]